ncbi:MAG: hypothetical protein IAI50_00625, partial [Candidatus Eremiobacteraeota bacterium]|nr:hypothetical protein [Candidatus Eremiobacteraeota bacterium]
MNIFLTLAWFAAAVTAAATEAASDAAPCRAAYVVPYAEQCDFAFAGLKTKSSPRDLSQAFDTCGRSQDQDAACVKASDHQLHVVALSALYRSVTLQAEIAMYARQFRVAEALLRERLDVIGIVQREARPGDPA